MKKCCFECANCSEHYPSLIDSCDLDDHVIEDVENGICENFVQVEN